MDIVFLLLHLGQLSAPSSITVVGSSVFVQKNVLLLMSFDIGPEMKKAVERILLCIEIRDMNVTHLVAAAVVLARSGEKIDTQFSVLCNDVIGDIVDTDPNISCPMFYDKTIIKNILRYCRFI